MNVYGYSEGKVFPLHITKKRAQHVNLLLISQGDKRHFVTITNISRLLSHRTKHKCAMYYCKYCLHGFKNVEHRDEHEPRCCNFDVTRTEMPKKETTVF